MGLGLWPTSYEYTQTYLLLLNNAFTFATFYETLKKKWGLYFNFFTEETTEIPNLPNGNFCLLPQSKIICQGTEAST